MDDEGVFIGEQLFVDADDLEVVVDICRHVFIFEGFRMASADDPGSQGPAGVDISLSMRLFCPARTMGSSGLESMSNRLKVWSWAKSSSLRRDASSRMSARIHPFHNHRQHTPHFVAYSIVKEYLVPITSGPKRQGFQFP